MADNRNTPSASDLPHRVAETIRSHRLFAPASTVIAGISGGADSTALLHILASLPGHHLSIVAAHLNHCLRGDESDGDEGFCRNLAEGLGIPFRSQRCDVHVFADSMGLNLEDAGRQARYRFLVSLREEFGADAIVLAHHADDQAETILMRLLRGSGITGLSGMAFRNDRGCVRPLLGVRRAEIEEYLSGRGITWREDSSNNNHTYLRNRIRHELLPLLEQYNPAVHRTLCSTASLLGDEDQLLDDLANRTAGGLCRRTGDSITCSVVSLQELHPALERRVIRRLILDLTGSLEQITTRHIGSIMELLESRRPNSCLHLPRSITVIREYGLLRISQTANAPLEKSWEVAITAPGTYILPGGCHLQVETAGSTDEPAAVGPDTILIDIAVAPFPWLVRTFRPGDRFRPSGMPGSKKVKDLFIDRKVPAAQRRQIPLLFCGSELLWVCGIRASQTASPHHPHSGFRVRYTSKQ